MFTLDNNVKLSHLNNVRLNDQNTRLTHEISSFQPNLGGSPHDPSRKFANNLSF